MAYLGRLPLLALVCIATALPAFPDPTPKVVHTEAEWKKILTPKEYRVLRQRGTEPAGTGALK